MKVSDLKYIKDIVDRYGKDLSDFDLSNKLFVNCDFSNITLPKRNDLFQKAKDKDLSGSTFSNIDLSIYSLDGVNINGVNISKEVILPDDPKLFQKIKDRDLSNVYLPNLDYSIYNFDGVSLIGTKFYENSVLKIDKDFFQRVKNKNLNFATLPIADYSNCNFEGVSMYYTKFGRNSLMPKDYDLFKKIAMLKDSSFMENCIDDIHLYDLSSVPYNLKISGIDEIQSVLLYKRYIEYNENSRIKLTNILC